MFYKIVDKVNFYICWRISNNSIHQINSLWGEI